MLYLSDSDGIVLSSTDYLTLVAPRTLDFSLEVWIKGNSFTGDLISSDFNSVGIFKLFISGSDLLVTDVGSTYTFTGAYSSLSSTGWNLLGVSFGILGGSTNTGICCLWVGNNANSKCLYSGSSTFYTNIISAPGSMTFKIGQTFTGTIAKFYFYDYIKTPSEFLKIENMPMNQLKYNCK